MRVKGVGEGGSEGTFHFHFIINQKTKKSYEGEPPPFPVFQHITNIDTKQGGGNGS